MGLFSTLSPLLPSLSLSASVPGVNLSFFLSNYTVLSSSPCVFPWVSMSLCKEWLFLVLMGILTCKSIAVVVYLHVDVCVFHCALLHVDCCSTRQPPCGFRPLQSRRLYGLIVITVLSCAYVQFRLSLQASNPLRRISNSNCAVKLSFLLFCRSPLNPFPRLDMKQFYVKKEIIIILKKKSRSAQENLSENCMRPNSRGGKKMNNKRKTLPLALLSHFFSPIQFPLFKTGADLSNIAANLTSKGCRYVKTLFNCDKEYAFMRICSPLFVWTEPTNAEAVFSLGN